MVIPIILKGSRISQMMGNRNSIMKASGQHKTNRIKKSASAINVLTVISFCYHSLSKMMARFISTAIE
jgi:hypothetical protein